MSYLIPRLDPHYLELEKEEKSLLAFDISKSVNEYLSSHPNVSLTPAHFLSFTQRAWRVSSKRAEKIPYILAVVKTHDNKRQIVGVFTPSREEDVFFHPEYEKESRKCIFLAPADEPIWNQYVGLFLPETKPGQQNPISYFEQD